MIKVILDEGLQKDDFLKAHTTAPCLIDKATGVSFLAKDDDETSYQVMTPKRTKSSRTTQAASIRCSQPKAPILR